LKFIIVQVEVSKLLKVIETDTNESATYDFLLVVHNNHVPISCCFRDIRRFRSQTAN